MHVFMNSPSPSIRSLAVSPAAGQPISCSEAHIPAGFPSPAQDYLEDRIDLNTALIGNPTATFLARISGDSMRDLGVFDGDLIVVDRSLTPRSGDVVLAWVQGGFTVKTFRVRGRRAFLVAAHPDYPELELLEDAGDGIWGVVLHVIRSFRKSPAA